MIFLYWFDNEELKSKTFADDDEVHAFTDQIWIAGVAIERWYQYDDNEAYFHTSPLAPFGSWWKSVKDGRGGRVFKWSPIRIITEVPESIRLLHSLNEVG